MPELKDLIKIYPELGDELAEISNRLSFLENSLPSPVGEMPQKIEEPKWIRRQWATVLSLKEEFEGFRKRFYQGLDEINQKSKSKRHKY